MARQKMKEVEISFETPDSLFGIPLPKMSIKGTFAPEEAERNFSWAIYVELTTRITLANLAPGAGSLREALTSYYSVFKIVREQLHAVGPDVARRRAEGALPVAASALWMLNGVLRPLLAEWHPRLARYEETRPENVGVFTHEAAWPDADALRKDLAAARARTRPFAELFETICDVHPSLIPTDQQ